MPRTAQGCWRQTELETLRAIKKLGAATLADLGVELSLHPYWVSQKVKILKDANRIYIAGWEKKYLQGPSRPLFSLRIDSEEDEPPPVPITDSQKSMNYLKRKKLKELLFHDKRCND